MNGQIVKLQLYCNEFICNVEKASAFEISLMQRSYFKVHWKQWTLLKLQSIKQNQLSFVIHELFHELFHELLHIIAVVYLQSLHCIGTFGVHKNWFGLPMVSSVKRPNVSRNCWLCSSMPKVMEGEMNVSGVKLVWQHLKTLSTWTVRFIAPDMRMAIVMLLIMGRMIILTLMRMLMMVELLIIHSFRPFL